MNDGLQAKADFSNWLGGLEALGGPIKLSLARSMGVAGGTVIRDEAKEHAPVRDGVLRDAIYLAYREAYSNDTTVTYAISWNSKKAPHGHLIEFGHWQTNYLYQGDDGNWHAAQPLARPRWVPAHPFLRPALDGAAMAYGVMIKRGRERLPELIAEYAR